MLFLEKTFSYSTFPIDQATVCDYTPQEAHGMPFFLMFVKLYHHKHGAHSSHYVAIYKDALKYALVIPQMC